MEGGVGFTLVYFNASQRGWSSVFGNIYGIRNSVFVEDNPIYFLSGNLSLRSWVPLDKYNQKKPLKFTPDFTP